MLHCIQQGCYLLDLPLSALKEASPLIEEDIYEALKPEEAVRRRNSAGGTGFTQVSAAIEKARELLK